LIQSNWVESDIDSILALVFCGDKKKNHYNVKLIEAFGGIIKFNHKGAIATVTGHITSLESCDVIKKGHPSYKEALSTILSAEKEFAKNISDSYQKKIQELENKLFGL